MEKYKKEFINNYFIELANGVPKTRQLLEQFITDEALIGHIEFFESAFPGYEVSADEMTAEGNRVVVQARLKGTHTGNLGSIPPTFKTVDLPFAIRYEIENNKIVSHWMVVD